jgi:hypothetical protein
MAEREIAPGLEVDPDDAEEFMDIVARFDFGGDR